MKQECKDKLIRNFPIEIWELMKDRAKRHHRSLSMQIVADLEEAANSEKALQQSASEEYAQQQSEDARS